MNKHTRGPDHVYYVHVIWATGKTFSSVIPQESQCNRCSDLALKVYRQTNRQPATAGWQSVNRRTKMEESSRYRYMYSEPKPVTTTTSNK